MAQIPKEEASAPVGANGPVDPTVKGGAFSQTTEAETPFGFGRVSCQKTCEIVGLCNLN